MVSSVLPSQRWRPTTWTPCSTTSWSRSDSTKTCSPSISTERKAPTDPKWSSEASMRASSPEKSTTQTSKTDTIGPSRQTRSSSVERTLVYATDAMSLLIPALLSSPDPLESLESSSVQNLPPPPSSPHLLH